MIVVRIPVHPISRKIILRECQPTPDQPIVIKKKHLLMQLLMYEEKGLSIEYLRNTLTQVIDVRMGRKYGLQVRRNYSAGYHVYKYHMDLMLRFMFGQVASGTPAYSAMLNWYDIYGLDDNDLTYDASYKRWQRWISDFEFIKKTGKRWTHRAHSGKSASNLFPLTEEDVLQTANAYIAEVLHKCFDDHERISSTMIQRILIYFYREHGDRPIGDLQRRFGLSRSAIFHNVARFKEILETEPAFSEPMESLLSTESAV